MSYNPPNKWFHMLSLKRIQNLSVFRSPIFHFIFWPRGRSIVFRLVSTLYPGGNVCIIPFSRQNDHSFFASSVYVNLSLRESLLLAPTGDLNVMISYYRSVRLRLSI